MGVKGLWRLLLPIGRRISIETLEGKILAIDASIWLTQFLAALKDPNTGNTMPAAHLVGFLRRLCKLRYHGIRPVLVFDGATPEIKLRELKDRRQRREQFRSKGEDGGIVRMAKKLLTQQLQKHGRNFIKVAAEETKAKTEEEKKGQRSENGGKREGSSQESATKRVSASASASGTSTSLAPGFYDPDIEDDDDKSKKEIEGKTDPNETVDSEHDDDDRDILEILNDEEEAARKAREEELGKEANDWDRAVVSTSAPQKEQERKQKEHNEQQKNIAGSQPKWNYGRRTKKKGTASSYAAFRNQTPNGKFDVSYVASLPSHERKDWVEEAQKNRRMQSRREFMKVAYDQERFSHSQLQNFLKSSKLNQDIHKMATKAAKEEKSSELGVRQAGDRTKRIIFERDVESKQQSQKRSKAELLAEFSKKKLSILEEDDNNKSAGDKSDDDDDSDEIEWQDADEKPAAAAATTAIVDDDSSDSDNEPKLDGKHKAIPFFSNNDSKKPSKGRIDQNTTTSRKSVPSQKVESVARRPNVSHYDSDDSSDNNNVTMDADARLAQQLQEQEDERGGDNNDEKDADARLAQQLQEQELAMALQEDVDAADNASDDGVVFLPAGESDPDYYFTSDDDSEGGGGGFLVPTSTDNNVEINGGSFLALSPARAAKAANVDSYSPPADAKMAQQLADEKFAMALQNAEYEDNGGVGGGGGFLRADENGTNFYKPSDTDSNKGGGGFLASEDNEKASGVNGGGFLASSPAKAMESADEKMAMALQQAEYEGNNEGSGGFLPLSEVSVVGVKPAPTNTLEADDRKPAARMQTAENQANVDSGGFIPNNGGSNLKPPPSASVVTHITKPSIAPIVSTSHDDDDEDDDDDIDWEDGGLENGDVTQENEKITLDAAESHPSSRDVVARPQHEEVAKEDTPGVPQQQKISSQERLASQSTVISDLYSHNEKQTKDVMVLDDFDELPSSATTNDWDIGSSKSEKVSEALTHAQDTASRLTNWAGRAFRRAVADHAEESGTAVPEASKPTSLLPSKSNVTTTEDGSDDDEPVVVMHQQFHQRAPVEEKQADRGRKGGGQQPTSSPYFDSSGSQAGGTITSHQQMEEDMAAFASRETQSTEMMETVTDEMKAEVMQLLHLCGVPFVEAPAEAESQCVMLEQLGLVDGVVTEDSDAFVFGGKHVYKNIFDDKKYVEIYNAQDAEREMNLTRDGMVGLALLMGGDYTQGVNGVGIVNGMEIIHAFDVSQDINNLQRFRQWLDGFDAKDALKKKKKKEEKKEELTKEEEFNRKHRTARTRWEAPKHFPDPRVLSAYLNPVVDKSDSSFSWGVPDLDGLVSFCTRNIGWTPAETKALLKPVLKRIAESGSMRQTRLDTFMRYEDGIKFADVRSKRLREVLESVQGGDKAESSKKQKTNNYRSNTNPSPTPQKQQHSSTTSNLFYDSGSSDSNDDVQVVKVASPEQKTASTQSQPQTKPKPAVKKKKTILSTASLLKSTQATHRLLAGEDDAENMPAARPTKPSAPKDAPSVPPPAYQRRSDVVMADREEKEIRALEKQQRSGKSRSKKLSHDS
eukprot:CAMPEP_0113639228 /NCGR_PEP_ID=MMETSP0017_2-20120614/20573_1 /TAXON_ID=2856 /ORGANISM="Cylindrotheca closterium" /LENGTH=1563 /DNA_ID=CAMNT_0000550419 /DNA_START=18 /DNA_END=4706 /DNA_ORIENTATION=- /assembly_acc=CAM_ASM_000147